MATGTSSSSGNGGTQWVDAAFTRFRAGGLSAIRVEAIARELGTSKGSFYWHFRNRAELVAAVMQRWERDDTSRAIEAADAAGSPRDRIVALFDAVGAQAGSGDGELQLYREAEAEGVASIVADVSERRIAYLAKLLEEEGFTAIDARARSVASVALVLGARQLASVPGLHLPSPADFSRTALEMLLGEAP